LPDRKLNSIIHSSTSVEERGTLYMQKETETISIPIDTKNFFTTLDSLSSSTETLLDTNLFDTEKDFTVNSEGLTLHILKGRKTAEISRSICDSENLKLFEPINMVVMNWDDRLHSITTGMTIEITESKISCKSDTESKTDQACIKYLRQMAKRSNHLFINSMTEFYNLYGKYKGQTKSIKINSTHIYAEDDDDGIFACVGDIESLSEIDVIEKGLRNNFFSTLGKVIFSKLQNLELDIYNVFDTLVELSSDSLLDPSLKINEITYNELTARILMYLPGPMQSCEKTSINVNKEDIDLDEFEDYTKANNEIEFFNFLRKTMRTQIPPATRLELTKTYIIILNFYIRISNRVKGLQKSEGKVNFKEKPWNILWNSDSTAQDLKCYCAQVLNNECSSRALRKLYHILSRDKLVAMTDLIYTLNLGQDFIPSKPKQMMRKKFTNKAIIISNSAKDLNQALSMSKQDFNSNDINRPQQDQSGDNLIDTNEPTIERLQNDQAPPNDIETNNEDNIIDYNSIPVIDAGDNQEPRTRRYTNLLEENIYENPLELNQQTTDSQQTNAMFTTTLESILSTTTTSILYMMDHISSHSYSSDMTNTPTLRISPSDITTEQQTTATTTTISTSITSEMSYSMTTTTTSTTTTSTTSAATPGEITTSRTATTLKTPTTSTSTTATTLRTPTTTTSTTTIITSTTSTTITTSTTTTRTRTPTSTTAFRSTTATTSQTSTTQRSRSQTTTKQPIRTTKRSTTRSTRITSTITTAYQSTTTTDTSSDYYDIPTIDEGNEVDSLVHQRLKRSFVSYWLSSMTGLAEENELEDMRRFENELLERENSLGSTFGNLTIQDEELTKRIQEISEKIAKSLTDEQSINEQITRIISSQVSGEENVNKILSILDKNIKRSNKLTQVIMELLLLEKTIDKYKLWITNVLMDRLDIFDLNMRDLSQHFGSSAIQSLKLSKAKITWENEEFTIIVTIRRLSEPFQIFNLKSMVVSFDKTNLEIGNALLIEPGVAINSIGEYVLSSEYIQKCTPVGNSIYCDSKDTLIHVNGTDTCELVIIHNWLNNDTKPYYPCYDNIVIRPTKQQDFIIKENSILIMSRTIDTGRYRCTGGSRETAKMLNVLAGLSKVVNINGCGLDTSYLSIPGGFVSHKTTMSINQEDLDMDQALIELNSYMESKLRKPFNLTGLIYTINSTQDKLLLEHKSLQELQLNVDTLNEMKTIPTFSFHPLHALTYDTHKLVTMGLSYTVLLILMLLICMCCFNVCTDSKSLFCGPCKCVLSAFKCCTQCFVFMGKRLKSDNEQGETHEFENLNNDNVHTVEPKIYNTPRLQSKWTIRTIDDEPYLIYTENEKLFKFDPVTGSAWSGREKNDDIPLPSKALQKALQKKRDESRKLIPEANRV